MRIVVYGVDFPHKKGEFCLRTVSDFFFISYFRTDFLVEIDGRLVKGNAGDMLIMPPGTPIYHGPCDEMDCGFRNDWIYVWGADLELLLKKYRLPLNTPFRIGHGGLLANAIARIHQENSYALVGMDDKCDMIMTDMLIDLFREYSKENTSQWEKRLEAVRRTLMKDANKPWTLQELAALAGYSASRFSALYQKTYGISPISDLVHLRIENAKRLLRYSNMTIQEIAEAVGFSSIYYFSKHFKKMTGYCPTDYKREFLQLENTKRFKDSSDLCEF